MPSRTPPWSDGSACFCLAYRHGQRCTALKLLFVHDSIADEFVEKFCAAVDALKLGLPWEDGVKLTPLPEPNKPKYLVELIDDATSKGAKVCNGLGGQANGLAQLGHVAGPPAIVEECDGLGRERRVGIDLAQGRRRERGNVGAPIVEGLHGG